MKRAKQRRAADGVRPAADVYARPDALEILVDVPGAEPESLDITVQGDDLLVDAPATALEAGRPSGRRRRRYRRLFAVPDRTDRTKIRARLDDGVLRLTLPMAERVEPRRIPVEEG